MFWKNLRNWNCIEESINIEIYRSMILSLVLSGRHTWSVLLWEEHGMRVFENRVLRKIGFKNFLCQLAMLTKESALYRLSQEECARLRASVPYVKVYRYNPKHLYPKLYGYGDNGLRKVGASCGPKYCNLHSWCVVRQRWWPWEWNAVLIEPAWLLVACTGVRSAM